MERRLSNTSQSNTFWSPINISTLDQYNIQGDPAQPIVIPRKPDFDIQPSDIVFQSQTIYEQDDQFVKVSARNFGIASPDSVSLRIYERAQGAGTFTKISDTLFSKILVRDSLIIRLSFRNRSGVRELEFRVNEGGTIDEVNPANNIARTTIVVFPNDVVGTMPFNHTVLSANNPVFSIISSSAGLESGRTYQFELDSTMTFDSPAQRISGDLQEDTLITTWRPACLTQQRTIPAYFQLDMPHGSICRAEPPHLWRNLCASATSRRKSLCWNRRLRLCRS